MKATWLDDGTEIAVFHIYVNIIDAADIRMRNLAGYLDAPDLRDRGNRNRARPFLGVDPGQVEAARALGLSNLQTFIYVRIPAMWRLALPPFGNHMLSLIKDTALVAIIAFSSSVSASSGGH